MADLQKRITKSGAVRWDVRYRDHARGQRKRSFDRKLDAQRFARSVETDLLRGDWIDPRRGQELFEVSVATIPTCGGDSRFYLVVDDGDELFERACRRGNRVRPRRNDGRRPH